MNRVHQQPPVWPQLGGRQQRVVAVATACAAVAFAAQAWARYHTIHHRTFDLALYGRLAWGLAHGDARSTIVDLPFIVGHAPLVLWPLGWLGRLLGTVPVLLITQALALAATTVPVYLAGAAVERTRGVRGCGVLSAFAYLLYPNLSHVAAYEFHPGNLALPAIGLGLWALTVRNARVLCICCACVVLCNADLALLTAMLGVSYGLTAGPSRRVGAGVFVASGLYFAAIHLGAAAFSSAGPTSADLHFGPWGGSPLGFVAAMVNAPGRVVAHLSTPERLTYPVRVLAPMLALPLLAPRYLLVAVPVFAINLISVFPTTTGLYSHYLTPAVPVVAVAAGVGLSRLIALTHGARGAGCTQPPRPPVRFSPRSGQALVSAAGSGIVASTAHAPPSPCVGNPGTRSRSFDKPLAVLWLGSGVLAQFMAGGWPGMRGYVAADFEWDHRSEARAKVLSMIPDGVSVQAPDALLPHLIERPTVHRAAPPDRGTELVVLDTSHRIRYAGQATLLRTTEEPHTRRWLAREDYGLVGAAPGYLVMSRRSPPREGLNQHYFDEPQAAWTGFKRLTDCLWVIGTERVDVGIELWLQALAACPADLALRVAIPGGPARVDLLFDGHLSPAHLKAGDRLRSRHRLPRSIPEGYVNIGLIRSSGARPLPEDPASVQVVYPANRASGAP